MIVVAVMMMPFIVLVIIIVSFRRRTKSRSDAEYDKSDKCVFHFAVSLWDGFPTAPNFNGKIGSDTRQRPQDPTEVVCSRGVPLVACCPYNAASEFLDLGATHRRCPLLRLNVDNIQSQSIFFDKPIYAYGLRGISATASITHFYQQLDDDSLEHRRSLALWSWHRPTDCQPPSKHSILICLSRCGGLRSARTTLHDRLRSTLTSGRI